MLKKESLKIGVITIESEIDRLRAYSGSLDTDSSNTWTAFRLTLEHDSLKAAKATLALNSELKTRRVRRPDDLLMMIS